MVHLVCLGFLHVFLHTVLKCFLLLLEKWGFFCPVVSSTFIIPHQICLWWKDSPSSCSDKTKFAKQIERTDLSAKLCIQPRVWSVAYKSCGSPGSWCCHTPHVGCAGVFQHHLSNVVHHVQGYQEWLPGAQGPLVSPRYEYHWADGTNIKKPIKCSAPKYIDYLMTWVQDQLDDETLFPSKIGEGGTAAEQGTRVTPAQGHSRGERSPQCLMCGARLGGYIICLHTLIFEGVL